MRYPIVPAAMLVASVLCPLAADAETVSAACAATPENARYQLDRASGDAAKALQDWLHYCPNDALMVQYAEEIRRAQGASAGKAAPAPTPAVIAPSQPALKAKAEPYGTFANSGRKSFDDHSGYEEWDDWVTIHEDGTAELQTKYKMSLGPKWHLTGCEDSAQASSALLRQRYTVTMSGDTLSFKRQGPIEVLRKEPDCWEFSKDDFYAETWSLEWRNGRLTNESGEYFRQD